MEPVPGCFELLLGLLVQRSKRRSKTFLQRDLVVIRAVRWELVGSGLLKHLGQVMVIFGYMSSKFLIIIGSQI